MLHAIYAWPGISWTSHCHVQVSIKRLLARHQAAAHPLLNPQARGSRASHAMEAAMHYITSSSLFAGRSISAAHQALPLAFVLLRTTGLPCQAPNHLGRLLCWQVPACKPVLSASPHQHLHCPHQAAHLSLHRSVHAGKYVMEGGKVVGDCAVTVNGRRQPWEKHGEVGAMQA